MNNELVYYRKITQKFMLDTKYPYPTSFVSTSPNGDRWIVAKDSPTAVLPNNGSLQRYIAQKEFRMYLMWNPGTPSAIDVPLCVTPWDVGWEVYWDSNAASWKILWSYHSTDPASYETTDFPEWDANVADLEWSTVD